MSEAAALNGPWVRERPVRRSLFSPLSTRLAGAQPAHVSRSIEIRFNARRDAGLTVITASGTSAAPALRDALAQVLASQTAFTQVVDGRFKGGYITRRYGQPDQGVHAVQLEMCWSAYMDEAPPHAWHPSRAAAVTPLLTRLVQTMLQWKPAA